MLLAAHYKRPPRGKPEFCARPLSIADAFVLMIMQVHIGLVLNFKNVYFIASIQMDSG